MKHPNAIIGGGSGIALGPAVVEVLALAGVEISSTLGAVIGALAAGAVLLIGRDGVRGIARTLWHGRRK